MGFAFQSPVTVKSGTIVKWINQSTAPHSIVWDGFAPATSPAPGAGLAAFAAGTTSGTWTAPAVSVSTTYNYHCGIHGPTMSGVIMVNP
jgi:plastocyanin